MLDRVLKAGDPYILLMFATVAFVAAAPASGQYAVAVGGAAKVAIAFLFFLYGARTFRPGVASRLTTPTGLSGDASRSAHF